MEMASSVLVLKINAPIVALLLKSLYLKNQLLVLQFGQNLFIFVFILIEIQ